MNTTLDRSFYVPAAELCADVRTEGDVVIYSWVENGKLLAKGFAGRSNKPAFYHQYSTAEARTASINKFFADQKEAAERKAARAAEKADLKAALNAPVDLPVGTILEVSGGYEQTNVEFYKVKGHFGRLGVLLVEVAAKHDETRSSGNSMADYCNADATVEVGAIFKARQVDKAAAKFGRSYAMKWDGKPSYRSWYN